MKKMFVFVLLLSPFIVIAQNALTITSGAALSMSNGAVLVLSDMDLINSGGTFVAPAGSGVVRFTGTQNNNLSGGFTFDNIEIAKTGNAKLVLQANANSIYTSVKFVSGYFDLSNYSFVLTNTASLVNETETSRFISSGTGFVQMIPNLNAPNAVNPGNLGAVITSSQNLGSTIIRRGHVAQTDVATPNFSINRYFDIIPSNNTALNATLRINYFDAELNGKTEANLSAWKSNDNLNWTSAGFSNRNAASNFVEANNIAAFSRWTLSDKVATGIFDLPTGKNSIRVWPNPYTDMLTVGIESTRAAKATMQVFDITGKLMYSQPIAIIQGKNNLPVRLSSLAKGVYQLRVIGMEGSVAVIPIMKQ